MTAVSRAAANETMRGASSSKSSTADPPVPEGVELSIRTGADASARFFLFCLDTVSGTQPVTWS